MWAFFVIVETCFMPAGIDHSIQIFRKIIGKDIILHHKNILPTKLYSYATFVYIIFIIVQYNNNYKDKRNRNCPYRGETGRIFRFEG